MRAITRKQFSTDINHTITKAEFYDFVANYRKTYGAETAVFFDANAVQNLLRRKDAAGLRYYYAVDSGQPALVLTATSVRGRDLINGASLMVSIPNPPLTLKGRYNPGAAQHHIELEKAVLLTANFREGIRPGQVKGGFFGKQAILNILRQKSCVGIRFWFAAKENGIPVIALCGVDHNGKDMLNGYLAEMSLLCPPYCDVFLNPLIDGIYYEQQAEPAEAGTLESTDEILKLSA